MRFHPALLMPAILLLFACQKEVRECDSTAKPGLPQPETGGIEVTVADGLLATPYSGRVFVQIIPVSEHSPAEPRLANRWIDPPLILARDVESWDGNAISMADAPMHFPTRFEEIQKGDYRAQAFIRLDRFSADPGCGTADLISVPMDISVNGGETPSLMLMIDRGVESSPPEETDRERWLEIRSDALSEFHGFDYPMQAGIRLPAGWNAETAADYPILVFIGGFNEDHIETLRFISRNGSLFDKVVVITPNALNFSGHSVFVDSQSIGPWGTALMTELLPAIEKRLGLAGASKRFVSGISSGGWSSLWLQVRWPDEFQHAWSFAPDPVDFTDFQQINLYQEGDNFFTRPDGTRRPVGRFGGFHLWFDDFVQYEDILGPGGQIHSFEATFSPRGEDGRPIPLFNRETGAIDPAVADAFRKHDISAYLRHNWKELGPKLEGKLTVIGGSEDNFYLDGAVRRLADVLKDLGSDADVRVIEGMGHTIHQPTLGDMIEAMTQSE